MVQLVKIGNSHGVRIPKALIEQAELSHHELQLKLTDEGLLIKPLKKARCSWENSIQEAQAQYHLNDEEKQWLQTSVSTDDEWQW